MGVVQTWTRRPYVRLGELSWGSFDALSLVGVSPSSGRTRQWRRSFAGRVLGDWHNRPRRVLRRAQWRETFACEVSPRAILLIRRAWSSSRDFKAWYCHGGTSRYRPRDAGRLRRVQYRASPNIFRRHFCDRGRGTESDVTLAGVKHNSRRRSGVRRPAPVTRRR
jgi:hypothetical protein